MTISTLTRSLIAGLTVVAAVGCPLALQSSADERRSWPIVEQAPVEKSIPLRLGDAADCRQRVGSHRSHRLGRGHDSS